MWVAILAMVAPYPIFITLLYFYYKFFYKRLSQIFTKDDKDKYSNDLVPLKHQIHLLTNEINDMPTKVLHTIVGSSNSNKGALGELIGYIQLRASYDRIIPLGNIVDFVAIKFPEGNDPGCLDFIDVKTGDKSRLSKDQKYLQKLIDEKRINFIKLKVETNNETKPTTDQGGQ